MPVRREKVLETRCRRTFTAEQLRDPDTAVSNQVLRTCVHCGFCTATCPTFVLLGDELDSPRGRIYLIKDMLEADRPADGRGRATRRSLPVLPVLHDHLPVRRALHASGRSCAAPYRAHLSPPLAGRLLRCVLGTLLPRPALFRAAPAGRPADAAVGGLVPGSGMLSQRLRAMLAMAPRSLPPPSPRWSVRGVHPAQGVRRARVALLAGCAQQVLAPEINAATIRLLNRLGVEVVVRKDSGLLRRAESPHGSARHGDGSGRAPTSPPGSPRSRARAWTRSSSTRRAAARW